MTILQKGPLLPRRVVVTGMGAITPLGATFSQTWQRLLQQECGCTTLQQAGLDCDWVQDLPCQVAAPVRPEWIDPHNSRNTNRFVQLALQAANQAIQQAHLTSWFSSSNGDDDTTSDHVLYRRQRAGVSIGSGMSAVAEIVKATHTMEQGGPRKLSPYFVPNVLANSAAGRVSLAWHLQGPGLAPATACAAGSHAIGEAAQCIQYNQADIMLAGGTEACIDPVSIAGFCRMRALSTQFPPEQASRPFDVHRDGFVMGEGAAILVLEELEHALARRAPILAELVGYGWSSDAHHSTAPDPEGRGAARAMQMALSQEVESVDYVNAHATSTPKGDEIEARVIDQVLLQQTTSRERDLYVSSTKGATGHLLGAAGALEAAITVQTLVDGQIPPTLNLTQPQDVGFQHVYETLQVPDMDVAVSNSFGFGGTNACLVFRKMT